jgi:glutathione synthase/RimK-type ligase-like ATP-grasp enzyme
MTKTVLYSYSSKSQGAKKLAEALDIPMIHFKSKFKNSEDTVIINWGASSWPFTAIGNQKIYNWPDTVYKAINKLYFFQTMTDAPDPPRIPPWTTSQTVAVVWNASGVPVVVRNILTGHGGDGIIIVEPKGLFPVEQAPLYTQYIHKTHEFRVHIMKGKIFDYQEKVPAKDTEPKNWYIRNHDNGFKFVRGGVTLPEDVRKQSLKAFMASGLDFASFDIVYCAGTNKAYVLEANTASGLVGKTVESYTNAFKELLNSQNS